MHKLEIQKSNRLSKSKQHSFYPLERNQKLFSCFQDIMHQNCTGEIKMNKRTWY
jgi:hypothetical protein